MVDVYEGDLNISCHRDTQAGLRKSKLLYMCVCVLKTIEDADSWRTASAATGSQRGG